MPGCLTLAEAGRKATETKCAVPMDFQTRTNEFYQEAVRRVHAGDIGYALRRSRLLRRSFGAATTTPAIRRARSASWGLDRMLSGDTITEQFIHALDVATWVVDAAPVKAYGACGKNGRNDAGTCHDHFNVIYPVPQGRAPDFTGTQFGTGDGDIGCRIFGPQEWSIRTIPASCILSAASRSRAASTRIFMPTGRSATSPRSTRHGKGDCGNATVATSVRSNLTTILGRTAAYKKAEVTWDEMIGAGEKLELSMAGPKS